MKLDDEGQFGIVADCLKVMVVDYLVGSEISI
jgi:hypothetical protein